MAVPGRHKKINCFFAKHKLFHHSKWSCTTDLNTTNIVLFKSARELQQIDHFDRQLEKSKFTRNSYQRATSSSYSHFLIDFDPKASESFQYHRTIPTFFYLTSCLAKVTSVTSEREKRAFTEALAKQKQKERFQKHFV